MRLGTGEKFNNTAIAIGTFDGLHKAHMSVIETLKQKAAGRTTVIFTFEGLPRAYFKPTDAIFTPEEKLEAFSQTGIDVLVMEKFDARMAETSAEDFLAMLKQRFGCTLIVSGYNHTFGAGGKGNAAMLKEFGEKNGIEIVTVPEITLEGGPVSSTRVRTLIEAGDVETAAKLLGRPFGYKETVVRGKRLGRTIGFPTVNFTLPEGKLCPKNGVYVSLAEYGGKAYPGMTNVGIRPTVEEGARRNVETHLFGFEEDIYGREVQVSLLKYLRPERRFTDVDELTEQLKRDSKSVREYFENSLYRAEKP